MNVFNKLKNMQKEKFDLYSSNGWVNISREDMISQMVDKLLGYLFRPTEDPLLLYVSDIERVKAFGIEDGEPINWGDLKCCEVQSLLGGSFIVTIDEAAPDACPTLCAYVEKYLRAWGWEVKVETEW